MDRAWIDGRATTLKAAIAEAANLLSSSRFPVIAGLGTDIAGARAAIELARRIGAVVDHMHARPLLAHLDAVRESGTLITTPGEAVARADRILLLGPSIATAFPELRELVAAPTGPETGATGRRIFWLCPDRAAVAALGDALDLAVIGRNRAELPILLAALRARIAQRPIARTSVSVKAIDALAADLAAARFGVVLWSTADLDALTTEMVYGVVADLNMKARFAGLPLHPGDNAQGVLQVCGWMTGFPMRTGFGRSQPEHDPWHFDAARLVATGEADCALWISAYRAAAPDWANDVPTIALAGTEIGLRRPARVAIGVGQPGIDHDGVEYVAVAGTLAAVAAARPSSTPSVAQVLAEVTLALPHASA